MKLENDFTNKPIASCAYNAYGFRIKFEWARPEYKKVVDSIIVPDWKECRDGTFDTTYSLSGKPNAVWIDHDGDPVWRGISLDSSVDNLRRASQLCLATHCRDFLFVHAGVVRAPGGLVLIPGRTFSGKSTLVKALLDNGCNYYSDEFARIDPQGYIYPYPRPLRERTGTHSYRYTKAEELGWDPNAKPERVRLVLSTSFENGLKTWTPTPLSPARTLLKLLAHTVSARLAPERSLEILTAALSDDPTCLDGPRGETGLTLETLKQMLPTLLRTGHSPAQ